MKSLFYAAFFIVLVSFTGCGGTPSDQPETASVTGNVSLDGKPLNNAIVTFTPQGKGRPSSGVTDSEGYYSLMYTVETSGAMIGQHTVTVELVQNDEENSGYGGEGEEDLEEASGLPAVAKDGSIQKKVESGSNEIMISLSSEG